MHYRLSGAGKKLLAIAAAMGVVGMVGCAEPTFPFDPRALQQIERSKSRQVKDEPMRPLPTTLESPFLEQAADARTGKKPRPLPPPTTGPALGTEPTIRLSIKEVIQRTVANNYDIRVAGYDVAIDQTRVVEAAARFDPTFFTNMQWQNQNVLTGGQQIFLTSADETDNTAFTIESGLRQLLPSGGQAELKYSTQYGDNVPPTSNTNPFWTNTLSMELTQPLLRDFGLEVNSARISIARNNQRITLLEFRKAIEDRLQEIERIYWQLLTAERDVRIQEELLRQTIETAEILAKRIGQDVTRVQVSQANAAVESRRAGLVRSKSRVRDLSDQIKLQMSDIDLPVAGPTLVLTGSPPTEDAIRFDFADQIDTAMENRLELGQQQIRVDSAGIAARVAKNNLLPQLNFVGNVGLMGLAGNLGSAFTSQGDANHWSYTVGLQLEMPIGNRAARSIWQRSLLQRQQAIVSYQGLIDKVAADVAQALREVHTTWDEMAATRQSRFAAKDALDAIQLREDHQEPLTPTFVQLKLDAQERLANAWREEVTSISNYNIAISTLERAKGTLLRYNNVLMEEEQLPFGYTADKPLSKQEPYSY